MNIVGMQIEENRRNLKMTVLHRPGGTWSQTEINRLMGGLKTDVASDYEHPEHLILFGHHTKEQTLDALLGGTAYTATQITGVQSKEMVFMPGFA